jgi:hypothetical protein
MSILSRILPPSDPPLYRLIAPQASSVLGAWATHFPAYSEVVGYSSLGHFLMRDPRSQDYAVLHPFQRAAKSYGSFPSVSGFEAEVLQDPGFQEHVLAPAHVRAIAKHVGPLKPDEIYIPEPYPFLGGSCTPDTYSKGNVWVFADIVAQMQDL